MASRVVSFTLNGREIEVLVKPLTTLQKLLRERLGFTATKSGCQQGGCGSCNVLVNGELMMSCLLPAEESGFSFSSHDGEKLHFIERIAAAGAEDIDLYGGRDFNGQRDSGFSRAGGRLDPEKTGLLPGFYAFGSSPNRALGLQTGGLGGLQGRPPQQRP